MKLNPNCIKDILTVFESIVCQAGTTYEISSWKRLLKESSDMVPPLTDISLYAGQPDLFVSSVLCIVGQKRGNCFRILDFS